MGPAPPLGPLLPRPQPQALPVAASPLLAQGWSAPTAMPRVQWLPYAASPRARAPATGGRARPFSAAVQSTLDQFLACIDNANPEQRNVALVDFLLATATLAPEIRRSGTPLGALQMAAMRAVLTADGAPGTPVEAHLSNEAPLTERSAADAEDANEWTGMRSGGEPAPAAAPQPRFGLPELKALLVARMEAARRAQMLAGVQVPARPQPEPGDGVRFALLPLLVLRANFRTPPALQRLAADRTELIQAGLALVTSPRHAGDAPAQGSPTTGADAPS